jgi:ATP-binding cassette subfamily B protein
VIAHRLSTVVKADNIVVMEEGRVVEQGTHASLIGNPSGVYARFNRLREEPQTDLLDDGAPVASAVGE